MFIDFAKAFDSVYRVYMERVCLRHPSVPDSRGPQSSRRSHRKWHDPLGTHAPRRALDREPSLAGPALSKAKWKSAAGACYHGHGLRGLHPAADDLIWGRSARAGCRDSGNEPRWAADQCREDEIHGAGRPGGLDGRVGDNLIERVDKFKYFGSYIDFVVRCDLATGLWRRRDGLRNTQREKTLLPVGEAIPPLDGG